MIDYVALLEASLQLIQPFSIFLLFIGVVVGVIIGILPGLGAPLGIALFLPFTFSLSSIHAFSLLLGIYSGAIYGGSISAIVLGIPGTPPSAATILDGHKMFENHRGEEALSYALIASVIGGIFSAICLTLIAPVLATFALKFGPPEYFSLGLFGILIVGKVSGKNVLKGIITAAIGVLLTTVGIDLISARTRFTFGSVNLYGGIPFIPLLIGMFAFSEMMLKGESQIVMVKSKEKLKIKMLDLKSLYRFKMLLLRSSIIGTIIGAIPAAGGAIGAFVSYGDAKRSSSHPELFGTGIPEGVIAPEAANNATIGGALIPSLTLGIPGSAAAAVLLGALMIQGFTPGPRLFQEAPELIYSIFIGLFIINGILLIVGMGAIRFAAKIINIPYNIIIPIVILLCFIGSYSIGNSMFGVWIMLWFGLLGYIFRKFEFPLPPCILGFILGPMIEVSLRQSLTLSGGSWSILFTRPISLIIYILIAIIYFAQPIIRRVHDGRFKQANKTSRT